MDADSAIRAGVRGTIAAMAMSGMRRVSTTLGLLERTPPEAILQDRAPRLFQRVPVARRPALVEAAHLTYGTLGGMVFGLLPRGWRRRAWMGPAYGALFWAGFAAVIEPALGLAETRPAHRRTQTVTLLADHLLYGVVVAASPWPYRD